MRIAYICADPGVPIWGRKGCSIHVQEVLRALVRRGAQVTLFATRFDGDPPPGLGSVGAVALPRLPKGKSEAEVARREQAALAANEDLCAALEREKPFDLVYERYSLWGFAGMEYARRNGLPGLLEVNAPLIEEQAEHRGLVDGAGARRVAERVFGAASGLIAVSGEVAAYLERYPSARGRVHVVPNGVDTARFPIGLVPSRLAPDVFTVGFVGTLKPWHGLPALVEAFAVVHAQDRATRLLVVGDGPQRAEMEEGLRKRGVAETAAHFTGAVDPSEVPGLLASMDVAAAPYQNSTNFYFSPLKVYEYLAAGLPVVASDIGQLSQVIRDNENGLLCPPGDAGALADALLRLKANPALRRRLGQAGRAAVLHAHSWDAVAARILSLSASPTTGDGLEKVRVRERNGSWSPAFLRIALFCAQSTAATAVLEAVC